MSAGTGRPVGPGALRRQARRLLAARERDRSRFAALLHDEVGQLLTALKLNLGDPGLASLEGRAGELIGDSRRTVAELVELVRSLMTDLYPAMLDDLGLVQTVRWALERAAAEGGFQVRLRESGMDRALPGDVRTAAFRIIQEALANVVRHAGARRVEVSLSQDGSAFRFEVADDGRGFDATQERHSPEPGGAFGLHGMEAWIGLLEGTLEIESTPGTGTRIRGSIPLGIANNNNASPDRHE